MLRARSLLKFLSVKQTNVQSSVVRYCRLNARASDELIPNIVKYQGFHYNNDLWEKNINYGRRDGVHTIHIFEQDMPEEEELRTTGEEIWDIFTLKLKSRDLGAGDLIDFFKAVKDEAQCSKYKETPEPVYTLSVCSLAPFCTLGVLSLVGGSAFEGLVFAQLAYGASILSFLGGLTSGHAIASGKTDFASLSWAAIPPLVAWLAPLLPLPLGFFVTGAGFTTALVHDVLLTSYPEWLKALRFLMSGVVLASLTPGFLSSLFL